MYVYIYTYIHMLYMPIRIRRNAHTMSGETKTKQESMRDGDKDKEKPMEDCMRECMRKLAIWYTRTFKPFMTHDELEPIMASLGFVALPLSGGGWKEYSFSALGWRRLSTELETVPPPRPRLPYPRIDGLHIYTYTAFLDAINFYLDKTNISDLFHIRGMPLHRVHDRSKLWRRMEEDDSVFVYREGTLDLAAQAFHHKNKNDLKTGTNGYNSTRIRNKGTSSPTCRIVPLADIIVCSSLY